MHFTAELVQPIILLQHAYGATHGSFYLHYHLNYLLLSISDPLSVESPASHTSPKIATTSSSLEKSNSSNMFSSPLKKPRIEGTYMLYKL